MSAHSPRYDDLSWRSLPKETEAPELWAWWADALARWLHSEAVRSWIAKGQGARRDPAGDEALLLDLFKVFEARSRASLYLVCSPGEGGGPAEPDAFGVRPFLTGEVRLSPFYPALWPDLKDALVRLRYGFARQETAAEEARLPTLEAWLAAEARGELQSPGVAELHALDLLPSLKWPDLVARRDAARRRR